MREVDEFNPSIAVFEAVVQRMGTGHQDGPRYPRAATSVARNRGRSNFLAGSLTGSLTGPRIGTRGEGELWFQRSIREEGTAGCVAKVRHDLSRRGPELVEIAAELDARRWHMV